MTTSKQPAAVLSDNDPLVDEVRAIRREISQQFDHDIDRLCEHLKEVERRYAYTNLVVLASLLMVVGLFSLVRVFTYPREYRRR